MTEAMPFLQKAILLSYDPRPFARGIFPFLSGDPERRHGVGHARGVQLADEKNLGDTLIMVDQLAFLVNVKNQTVITAMQSGDKANVFTNIDGTVIV